MSNLILIIDDDPFDTEMVQHALKETSLEVTYATSSAISDDLAELTPELVITDLKIYEYSGEETLYKIRHYFPECPLVVMSGIKPMDMDDLTKAYSVSAFVNKDDLLSSLKAVVEPLLIKT